MQKRSSSKFTTDAADASYEARFAAPSFDLARRNVDVLQALYEAMAPRFPVPINDLQAAGGQSMADLKVRVSLFGGRASIEIGAQSLKANFTGLRSDNDVSIARDCVTLAEEAIRSVWNDLTISEAVLDLQLQIELEGGEDAADKTLQSLSKAYIGLEEDGLEIKNWPMLYLKNASHKWQSIISVQNLLGRPGMLLTTTRSVYDTTGPYQTLDAQADHSQKLMEALWRHLHLERKVTGRA
jgi:hypothetical protein